MTRFLLSLLSLLAFYNIHAQKSKIDKAEQKLIYRKAATFVESAIMERNAGHVRIADSIINLSIDTYPTLEFYKYATMLLEESDIKGANKLIDKTFERVKEFEFDRLFVNVNLYGLIDMRKTTVLHEHATYALEINIPFGNLESIKKSYEVFMNNLVSFKLPLFSLDVKSAVGDEAFFKPRIIKQFDYKMEYFMLNKKYEEGLKYISNKPEGNYVKKDSYNPWKVEFYMKLEDDKNTLQSIKDLNKSSEAYYSNFFKLKKGDTISTITYFNQLHKDPESGSGSFTPTSRMIYNQALIDIYFHRYDIAINELKKALAVRGKPTFFGFVLEEYKWNIYTKLGDAYTAVGQFEKAKDAYNIALLAYPDYDETLKSVAALERQIIETKTKDKTAPTITLLEPTPKRGLKISTGSPKVLIKGNAIDASGIQEVKINDQPVYSQTSGDFWGEVVLKEGVNNIIISAKDLAGNNAIQTFEIEKLSAKSGNEENDENIIPAIAKTGKNICLLISAQNYNDINIPSLSNPIADAIKLKMILKKDYDFNESNIVTLFNPTKNETKQQLLELINKTQPEDNLIIFYAGHGIWVEKEKKGYWLMTDAKRNEINSWLPNKEILDLVAKIPSRHTLLITDACFSGSVFKTRGLSDGAPKAIQEMESKISRIAITSGNDTEVPDESVFMKYLIKALSENKEKYLTAQKMFITQILEAVMTESKTEPRYGTLELAGHVGGDFIFSKK